MSLYLIGDAGAPAPGREPVFEALRQQLRTRPGEQVVVFLGDNVYPRGLPAPDHPGRREAERRLAAQVELVTGSRGTGYFVPGNHDWKGQTKGDGWDAILRQERYIDSAGGGRVTLQPGGACPGPGVRDLGSRVRLIGLDTQWWLHAEPKPRGPGSECLTKESEIVDSIRASIQTAGSRMVVVVAHHPINSGGVHGGFFGWKDHLFPLRIVVPGLWLPLPLLGSLYPAARQNGISSQDIPSPAYQRLLRALRRAFRDRQPALYAAGHEHNLQVLAGRLARLELVSGSGFYRHSGRAVPVPGTLFARDASGFARLDVPGSGRARLAVLEVDQTGAGREVFSTWVE
jgi:hypothetical protein